MSHSSSKPSEQSNIPYGYCHCGCGQKTNLITETRRRLGLARGEPRRFLSGHHAKWLHDSSTYTVQKSDICEMVLSNGKAVIIDASDFDLVKSWSAWQHRNTWYARTNIALPNGKHTGILMHRLILGLEGDYEGDHINGDGLDNRRCNLRRASSKQNRYNQGVYPSSVSGYRGVSWCKPCQKWRARINVDGKEISLGVHETREQAALAYNVAATKFYGEFARLNEVVSE
jgi:hypothetical protein